MDESVLRPEGKMFKGTEKNSTNVVVIIHL